MRETERSRKERGYKGVLCCSISSSSSRISRTCTCFGFGTCNSNFFRSPAHSRYLPRRWREILVTVCFEGQRWMGGQAVDVWPNLLVENETSKKRQSLRGARFPETPTSLVQPDAVFVEAGRSSSSNHFIIDFLHIYISSGALVLATNI